MKAKKFLTLTNIMAILMILLYILDRWIIPIPDNYQGLNWSTLYDEEIKERFGEEYNQLPPEVLQTLEISKHISGNTGGVITNALGVVDTSINPNGNSFYRYFTVVFTHGFHLHLITNVLAFLIIGNFIEKKFGIIPMIILFFATDIIGVPITNLIWQEYSPVIVGASGGIFGLFGVGLAMCLKNKQLFKDFSKLKIVYLCIYGIVPTYILSFGWTTIVHNISFLLGIIFGFLISFIPYFKKKIMDVKIEEKKPKKVTQ